MARSRINWPLLAVLVAAFVVVVFVAFTLRKWQLNRMGLKARQAGLAAWQQQDWKDAAKNLSAYLSVNSSDVDILGKYAFAQLNIRPLRQSNFQQAVAAYRSILRIDKSNETTAQNLINLYLRLNVPAEAQLVAERYLQAADNPRIRILLATAMAKQGRFEEAAAQLQTVTSENPSLIIAYDTLAQLKEQNPKKLPALPGAEHWLNEAVKTNPSLAAAFIARAAFYLRKNDKIGALADLEEAERLDHSDPKVCLQLARAFGDAGLFGKARSYLINVQNVEPGNPALWQIWARLALVSGSKEEMLYVAQNGLKALAPSQWDFMPLACELFIYCGKGDDAANCIAKLKQKDIEPARTAFLEALLAQSNKQYDKAIFFLRRAEQLGDTSEQIHLALADAYCRTGDYQSAALQLRALVDEKPNCLRGRLEFARLLCQTENWLDAQQQAQAALAIAPNDVDAALICIEAKMHLIDDSKTESADAVLSDLEKQLADTSQQTKDNPAVTLLHFQIAVKKKDFVQARHLFEDLQLYKDSRIEIALAEIDLFLAEGKIELAIEKLQELVNKFPQNAQPVKQLAFLLARNGDEDKCEKLLNDAVQRIELSSAKRELGLLLEHFYQQWNQNYTAWLYLTSLSRQLPDDIPIKQKLLTYEQLLKDPAEAQKIVDEIKALEGENGWQWRYEQAKLWLADDDFEKRYPQIISLLKENITANPADKMSLALLAHTYHKGGEIQLSSSVYCQALNRWPNDAELILSAVIRLNQAKEYQRADEILDRAAASGINNPQISRLLLNSYLRRGKIDSAQAVLYNLIVAEPNNPDLNLPSAILKIQQNKYDEAFELLNRLKMQEPASFQVSAAMVELNAQQKKEKETIELCNNMVEKFGNAACYMLRAKVYAMFGSSSEAEKDFEQAIILEPNNAEVWVAKSDFELSLGRIEQASSSIGRAVALMPESNSIRERAAGLLLSSKNHENLKLGTQILDKALSADPQNITLRLYKARSLIMQASPQAMEQAKFILEQITSEQPATPQAWVMLAQAHMKNSQLGPAMDKILRGLTYSPTDKSLLILKARAEAESSPSIALPTLEILREQFPADADVIVELADVYLRTDMADEAVDCLKKFLPHCKEDDRIKIKTILAAALYKNGNITEAERIFVSLHESAPDDTQVFVAHIEALKYAQNWDMLTHRINDRFRCGPNNSDTFIKIAESLASTGNLQAREIARQLLDKILQCEPNHVPAMNTLAMVLQSQGHSEQAAELYQKVIELKPDTVSAINNLAWILCEDQGKYYPALELAQKGIDQSGNYADLIDTRGMIYYRLGEYRKAVDDFSRCANLIGADSPHLAGSCFRLGRAQAAMGQSGEAADNLRKALDLNSQVRVLTEPEIDEAKNILSKLSGELKHDVITNRQK